MQSNRFRPFPHKPNRLLLLLLMFVLVLLMLAEDIRSHHEIFVRVFADTGAMQDILQICTTISASHVR